MSEEGLSGGGSCSSELFSSRSHPLLTVSPPEEDASGDKSEEMETLDKCEEKMVEEKDTLCFRSPAEVVLTYDSEVKVLQNSLEVNGKNED